MYELVKLMTWASFGVAIVTMGALLYLTVKTFQESRRAQKEASARAAKDMYYAPRPSEREVTRDLVRRAGESPRG